MLILFISLLLSFVISFLTRKVYLHFHWIDDPKSHLHAKVIHKKAVPRGGGIPIFLTVTFMSLLLFSLDKYLISIILGSLILTIVGILDDIFDIHPLWRLLTGLISALVVVGSGIGIAYVTNPLGAGVIHLDQPQLVIIFFGPHTIWVLADLFAIIFILWNMNIVNWSKGVDGQMPGFVAISLIMIGLLSTKFVDDPTNFNTMNLSFITAGAFLGFLYWNWYPQKMMPGYGAGSLAGFYLSILAIISGAKVATTLMVLAIPTADAIFTILRRIKSGKNPIWGDRGHLHHKLLDVLGWSKQQIALFYIFTSLSLGFVSLYLNTLGKIITMGLTFSMVFGFLIWAKFQKK